ncbi:MAG: 4'-phosphopantetheinyl transferase superfamily protein [Ignavibacteria bacterium]|nr:4'-phosphopantetheinyl transferase superfamily protein [Ignavibacteria bacterium]
MKLPAGEIHICILDTRKYEHEIIHFEKLLSGDELSKAGRFRIAKDRISYVICRGSLRSILSEYTGVNPSEIVFSYTSFGKPFIKDSEIKFNLSHSCDYAVIAFSGINEIGVDIERLREMPDAMNIASRYFSEKEILEFSGLKNESINTEFFKCWTKKEAFIKAKGEGLSYPLKNFSVSVGDSRRAEIIEITGNPAEAENWSLYEIEINNEYVSALAVKSLKADLVYRNLHWKFFNKTIVI